MRRMHLGVHECALCGGAFGIVLHHIKKRSQRGSDVEENLVYLCQGPGTNDCHGRLHDGDDQILWALNRHLARVESRAEGQVGNT